MLNIALYLFFHFDHKKQDRKIHVHIGVLRLLLKFILSINLIAIQNQYLKKEKLAYNISFSFAPTLLADIKKTRMTCVNSALTFYCYGKKSA
jgi:hypothetical protein